MEQPAEPVSGKRSFSFWRLLKRLFLWSVLILMVLTCSAFILLKVYEDDIKAYAIGAMNERLSSPVLIDPANIDVTLFSSFPFASVDFRNMRALDAWEGKKDTLFRAKSIALQFNMLNLFRGDHTFRKLEIDGMDLQLKVNKKGENNYSIFKKQEKDSAPSTFELHLEQIEFRNTQLRYADAGKKFEFRSRIGKTEMSGNFNDASYELIVNANLLVQDLRSDSTHYLEEKAVDLAFVFDARENTFHIREGKIKVADLHLAASGEYTLGEEEDHLLLKLSGEEMDIASVLSLLPASLTQKTSGFESEGEFRFDAEISGKASDPDFASGFSIRNGTITETSSSVTLDHVELSGDYLNHELSIHSFKADVEGGQIKGRMKIKGRDKPFIDLDLEGKMGLNELQGLLKIDTLSAVSGDIEMNMRYEGPLKSGKDLTAKDLDNINTSGSLKISNGALELKNSSMKVSAINGNFLLHNADVEVREFSCLALSSDLLLKGECRDLLGFLLSEDRSLTIEAAFVSSLLDLNELLANKNEETKSDTAYNLAFPDRVNLRLETRIAKTIFRDFEATQIKGDLLMKDRKLIMDPVTFKTMDGMVNTMLMVDADRTDDILITLDAKLQSINVNKLFSHMENFGQTYLVDKHMKGFATAELQFASVWGRDLSVDLDKIFARGHIVIERGELIGFEPFIEIADDLKKDVIMREFIETDEFRKKMEHIKFTRLENDIEIRKQKISIPKMEVRSSAMNITFFGTHTFNNEIDYHFSFLLSEVMTKQKKKRAEKNKEFGVEEDDGTGKILYYTMTGTTEDYVVKKDYKSKKEQRKEDIKKEKETLKDILREEFGWFKKDTTQKKKPDPKKQDKFILKWQEEPKKTEDEDEDF